jgi:hypothetical protein
MLRKDPNQRPGDAEIVRLFSAPKEKKPSRTKASPTSGPLNGLDRFMKK